MTAAGTTLGEQAVQALEIRKDVLIEAPLDVTFESVLAELGPEGELEEGKPFPMVFEAWPGGRWFRDLGEDAGHFWGHVQVIKPPTLIEICGPMFMSYPAWNHLQYRLAAEGDATRLKLTHRAMGLIPEDHRANIGSGWEGVIEHIRRLAARRVAGER